MSRSSPRKPAVKSQSSDVFIKSEVQVNEGSSIKTQSRLQETKDANLLCSVCLDYFTEPFVTKCGHTFCRICIIKAIRASNRCPKCGCRLENIETDVFPNFSVNELTTSVKNASKLASSVLELAKIAQRSRSYGKDDSSEAIPTELGALLMKNQHMFALSEVDSLIQELKKHRDQLSKQSHLFEIALLKKFLNKMKDEREAKLNELKLQVDTINSDLSMADEWLSKYRPEDRTAFSNSSTKKKRRKLDSMGLNSSLGSKEPSDSNTEDEFIEKINSQENRINHHFEDLKRHYFLSRLKIEKPQTKDKDESDALNRSDIQSVDESNVNDVCNQDNQKEELSEFSLCLKKFTQYNSVRPLATLSYTSDLFNTARIVSSIEFNEDKDLFAIAGVTKKIKVYDFNMVVKDMVDIHYPSSEMICSSKISCVAWNHFRKSHLASSDYEGCVNIWDVNTCQRIRTFQEHEKRAWSIDYNSIDTKLLASGSDDARVKLWASNVQRSVTCIEAKANVCSVKFNPSNCYNLAFGSADHNVHYYDIRNIKTPLKVFKGHKKAVSYVKFLNNDELISASTDSQLKMWQVSSKHSIRSYLGHINEKNFVGLSSDGDYIACGSENNSLYIYYKGISEPLFKFKFDLMRSFFDRGLHTQALNQNNGVNSKLDEDNGEFVSAVCWRQGTNVIVGANSQGIIKLLELV